MNSLNFIVSGFEGKGKGKGIVQPLNNPFSFLETLKTEYTKKLSKVLTDFSNPGLDKVTLLNTVKFYQKEISYIINFGILLNLGKFLLNTKEEIELRKMKSDLQKLEYSKSILFKKSILDTFENNKNINIEFLDKINYVLFLKLSKLIHKIKNSDLLEGKNSKNSIFSEKEQIFLLKILNDPFVDDTIIFFNNIFYEPMYSSLSKKFKLQILNLYLSGEKTTIELLEHSNRVAYLNFLLESGSYLKLENYKKLNFLDFNFVENLFKSNIIERDIFKLSTHSLEDEKSNINIFVNFINEFRNVFGLPKLEENFMNNFKVWSDLMKSEKI